jgi:hypothetical protein
MIIEKDFNIIFEHGCFTLNLLKNKKELKEDATDKYKIGGYYNELENALLAVVRYRKDKKYTGKEPYLPLLKDVKLYIKTKQDFKVLANSVYDPIYELKKELIKYD